MNSQRPHSALWLTGLTVALLASRLAAAPPAPGEVGNPEITGPEVIAHVKYLASDELQGRGSGTAGNNTAAEYIAGRFQAAGLQPAGTGSSYFQEFPVFTGVKAGPDNLLSITQGETAPPLRVSEEFMPLAFSKNGKVDAPVVFAGYGISRPDLKYDDYKGLDVKGKVVLVLRHTPDMDDEGKFGPNALLTYKTMTAREKGAAGILLLTGPLNEGPENLGLFRLDSASADCGIPAAFVKRDVVEKLLVPTRKTLKDLQVMMAHGAPQSFALPNTRASLQVDVLRQTAQTRNVVGLLEGSDPKLKNEVVVVGAHFDHLGLGDSHSLAESTEPAIHHGADDNASGTAGVLELAQYFAAHRDKLGRSVLFMSFSGEEMGLLGSNYWVKNPTLPLARIAAMVNLDMIGRLRSSKFSIIGAGSSPVWKGLIEEVAKGGDLTPQSGGASGFGGSDQQSFYAKDIPVLFFFTGVHPDYHKPSDTWDKINGEGEAKLLQFVAETTRRISWLPAKPQFTKSKDVEPSSGPSFKVSLGTIPDYAEEVEGVALQGVREGGPAAKAGMKAGDVIVEFAGKKIRNVEEYTAVLSGVKANVPVKIVVLRNKQRLTLTITPVPRKG